MGGGMVWCGVVWWGAGDRDCSRVEDPRFKSYLFCTVLLTHYLFVCFWFVLLSVTLQARLQRQFLNTSEHE